MTESDLSVINFDDVKKKYARELEISEKKAMSVDALIYSAPYDILVEFKNGNMKNYAADVRMKIRDSLLIYCDVIGKTISYTRENVHFILVYNESKNCSHNSGNSDHSSSGSASLKKIHAHMSARADEEYIRFDLKQFKKLYFKEVHTYTEHEFEEYLKTLPSQTPA